MIRVLGDGCNGTCVWVVVVVGRLGASVVECILVEDKWDPGCTSSESTVEQDDGSEHAMIAGVKLLLTGSIRTRREDGSATKDKATILRQT